MLAQITGCRDRQEELELALFAAQFEGSLQRPILPNPRLVAAARTSN